MGKKVRFFARHCFDILLFCGLCFSVYAIEKWWTPQKRGFFCNDESLQYPYRSSTVSSKTLIFTVLSVPTLVMLALELLQLTDYNNSNSNQHHQHHHQHSKSIKKMQRGAKSSNMITEKQDCMHFIYARLQCCYMHIGHYLFGLALTLIATEVTKFSIGRLRPHFFAICDPILPDGSNCSSAKNQGLYIYDYKCNAKLTNVTAHHLRDVGMSFPSGHASLFFYAMVYLAIYLQLTLSLNISKLLKHVLQFGCLLSAVYVGLTRISDFKHHWSDVAAGAALGTFVASLVTFVMAGFFKRTHQPLVLPNNEADTQRLPRTVKLPQVNATATATAMLPAYTFGTLPYMQAAPTSQHQYHYHNYGYVP